MTEAGHARARRAPFVDRAFRDPAQGRVVSVGRRARGP